MFIEIEGIDGVGKSKQCLLLKEWLEKNGRSALIVKELDCTDFGRGIRELLSGMTRDPWSEMFLFLSCKRHAFAQVIRPNLEAGNTVIADRGNGSFISYHASLLGVGRKELAHLLTYCTLESRPCMTILIDAPVEIALARIQEKDGQSRFDTVSCDFLEKQRQNFLRLAEESPNWVVVDGSQSIEEVQKSIRTHVVQVGGGM